MFKVISWTYIFIHCRRVYIQGQYWYTQLKRNATTKYWARSTVRFRAIMGRQLHNSVNTACGERAMPWAAIHAMICDHFMHVDPTGMFARTQTLLYIHVQYYKAMPLLHTSWINTSIRVWQMLQIEQMFQNKNMSVDLLESSWISLPMYCSNIPVPLAALVGNLAKFCARVPWMIRMSVRPETVRRDEWQNRAPSSCNDDDDVLWCSRHSL